MKYARKLAERSRVKNMPREPHEHHFVRVFKFQGVNWVRYQCAFCPYVDPRRYRTTSTQLAELVYRRGQRITDHLNRKYGAGAYEVSMPMATDVAAVQTDAGSLSTAGWLSGSGGTQSDPQGPSGTFLIVDQHIDEATGTRVIEEVVIFDADQEHGRRENVMIDSDHPHADSPDDDDEVPLADMKAEDLRKLAAELNIPGRSKMKRDELIKAIAEAQEGSPA